MNLFVLSQFSSDKLRNHRVSLSLSYVLEQIIAQTCDATFLYPEINDKIRFLKRYRHRIFKSWFTLKELPILKNKMNILLATVYLPSSLLVMLKYSNLFKQFDLRLAYILDAFQISDIDREVIPYLDHIFVIIPELADEINQVMPGKASFIPLGTDALKYGSNQTHRCIDVISYGRVNSEVHNYLQTNYNQPENSRIYCHSTFDTTFNPKASADVYNLQHHIMLLYKLLSKSQISLCFEPSQIERFRGYSTLTFRWFEGLASGCTIVGKKPFGKRVTELLDWENSTIDIPENPSEWLPFFEDLLDDQETLLANSERNYRESLLRHDLRYRLKDIFQTAGLPIPSKLNDEIVLLQEKALR